MTVRETVAALWFEHFTHKDWEEASDYEKGMARMATWSALRFLAEQSFDDIFKASPSITRSEHCQFRDTLIDITNEPRNDTT